MITTSDTQILGRSRREGGRRIRQWFQDLDDAAVSGSPAAYVFVMGSMSEILRCFDFNIVFPEITSLQMAVRQVAHEYLSEAEDFGYSPDICGYVKADVALQLRKGQHPMGAIPKPHVSVLTNACNTYIKWAEIWERFHHADTFTFDVPATRTRGGQTWPGDPGFEADLRYIKHQLGELIELCERITGIKFDIDRLREVLDHSNAMSRAFAKIIKLNKQRPAPFNALMDGTAYLGIMNAWRGTPEGRAYFEGLLEELEYAVEHGIGTVDEEAYRLVFLGVPCYPLFRRFNEMFAEHGGAFVNSTYLWFASGGANLDYEYDIDRPLESLAEGTLITVRDAMDSMFWPSDPMERVLAEYEVDGVVFHPIKSCRTVSTGLADTRRDMMERHDVPTLFVESDQMDRRVVSEAQMKNRIDAFFENLATRRKLSAASAVAGGDGEGR